MLPLVFLAVAALPLPPDIPPDLFPRLAERSDAEVELAGLMTLYPGRILHEPPRANDPNNAGRQPKIVELSREMFVQLTQNVYYVRIYDLEASLPEIEQELKHPAVILDLRYVTASERVSRKFAEVLSKAGLASTQLEGIGTLPEPDPLPEPVNTDKEHAPPLVLAMVNDQTSGPLEAWLAAFQERESVLAVGTPTAGQPGEYKEYPGQPGYFIITGELRPANGSIVGTGLQPRFLVNVTREQNAIAYFNVERGFSDLTSLLRHEHPAAATAPAATANPATTTAPASTAAAPEAGDLVLQRALDVVAALQVLGRVPSSKDSGTTKAPAAAQ